MNLVYIFDIWIFRYFILVIDIDLREISMKRLLTSFFCSCMNLLFLLYRWVSIVVIDFDFEEISKKRLKTSFFCGSCNNLLYLFDRWVFRQFIIEIDIDLHEISLKRLATSYFVVGVWISCLYLTPDSL